MKKLNQKQAILAISLFCGWFSSARAIVQCAPRNALRAAVKSRWTVGRAIAQKCAPAALLDVRECTGGTIAIRPRGPYGSGKGVMLLDDVEIMADGSVQIVGHDTVGHAFTRTYPPAIHRYGFRIHAVEAL